MQICEYFFENACYSVTKYYLCKQNNKRSLLMQKPATNSSSLVSKSLPIQFDKQANFFISNKLYFRYYLATQEDKNGVIEAIKWPRTNGEMEFSFLFGRREKC